MVSLPLFLQPSSLFWQCCPVHTFQQSSCTVSCYLSIIRKILDRHHTGVLFNCKNINLSKDMKWVIREVSAQCHNEVTVISLMRPE